MDISIIQFFFDTFQKETDLGPDIFFKPKILQLDNDLSLDHLSTNLLRSKVRDWTVNEPDNASLYGDIEINLGEFSVSEATEEYNYKQLDA